MKKSLLGSVALCCLFSAPVWAQSETFTQARSTQLGEVVVTAQKRTQNVQKTAIPITVLTGAQLRAESKNNLHELLKDVPSLQIQASPQGADIVIRGVGGNDVGNNADPDVAVMIDGVYNGNSSEVMTSVYDTQRIEVLRGPQGTIIGRNAAGGAVDINTNDPVMQKYGAGLNLGIGNYHLYHADGFVNVPILGDVLALRVAADRDSRDGYYTNNAGQINNEGARIKLKYQPNADFWALARFEYWGQKGYTESTVPNPVTQTATSCGGPPCALFKSANPGNPWNTQFVAGSPFQVLPVANDNRSYTSSLDVNWDVGFGTITLMPTMTRTISYQNTASLFAPSTPPITYGGGKQDQYTGEARLNSEASSPIAWVLGVYVLETDSQALDATGAALASTGATGTVYDYAYGSSTTTAPSTSVSGFGQATYPVTNKLRLTFGGRYNADNKSVSYGVCSTYVTGECVGNYMSPTGFNYKSPTGTISASYNAFTYKAGLEYDVTPAAMLYAQVSTGYKAGGFSTATSVPTQYAPETVTDYEIGLKSRWLDNRLQFNADAYYYQYHNQQIELHTYSDESDLFGSQYSYLIPSGLDVLQIIDENAGNSRYYGLEEQTRFNLTDVDQVSFDLAFEQANYGNFIIPTSSSGATAQPPGAVYYAANGSTPAYFNLTGQTEAHTPKWNGSFGYQHIFDFANGSTVTFHSSTHFQTKSYTTIQEWFANGNTIQKGYHQTDLYLNYASPAQNWTAGLWVKNLENNAIMTSVYPLYRETLDEPRTYGLTVGYTY